jgi:hypothetical protein
MAVLTHHTVHIEKLQLIILKNSITPYLYHTRVTACFVIFFGLTRYNERLRDL